MLEKMRELRKQTGMSMKQLGEKVGLAEVTISTYETGRSEPSLSVLCAIADELDCSLDMLVRGKEKDRPEGRSLQEMINDYENLSDEVLERNIAVSQAVLAERRLHARIQTEKKENQ